VFGVWCLGVLLIANKPEMKTKTATKPDFLPSRQGALLA
jgi:hypothetical protein